VFKRHLILNGSKRLSVKTNCSFIGASVIPRQSAAK